MSLSKYLEAPFGLDRRDSAVRKQSGILAELENMLLDQGSLQTRKGLTRYYGTSPLDVSAAHKILALHRFYGFNTRTGVSIEEFYAAINDGLQKSTGGAWSALSLPSGVTMTADTKGTFKQMKDRTYYSNGTDPVLMIKKEDSQVYEAGLPDPDVEKLITDCETLTDWTAQDIGSLASGNRDYSLDSGFDKHTRGDYSIMMEVNDSLSNGSRWFELLYTIPSGDYDSVNGMDLTTFTDGTDSTLNDYIAIDIFRYQKTTIDELSIEFSSTVQTANAFTKGFSLVVYKDSDYTSYSVAQRTMMAEWAMNPYSNKLFFGRFRKQWFIPIDPDDEDDWSAIKYVKIKLRHNFETTSSEPAKVTIDNIRLLKTPPMPAVLNLQVATCDAIEVEWQTLLGAPLANDVHHASQGASCKIIPAGSTAEYDWPGTKDLSQYNEGTAVADDDAFMFDVVHGASLSLVTIILYDTTGHTATALVGIQNNITNVQEKSVLKQNFIYNSTYDDDYDNGDGTLGLWTYPATETADFDWENVEKLQVVNPSPTPMYIDNFRFTRSKASKMINNFIPLDLTTWSLANVGIDHLFGENPLVDFLTNVSDFFMKWWANSTRRAQGQGHMVYPEYTMGRYPVGTSGVALPSLQMNVDAGGMFSVEIINANDLVQYETLNLNLGSFFLPRESNSSYLGVDWEEVEGQPSDEISIWMRSADINAVSKIRFRFYCDANASFNGDDSGTHEGVISDAKVLYDSLASFSMGMVGKRVVNETRAALGQANSQGFVVARVTSKMLMTTGVVWNTNDSYSINGYSFSDKPQPDADNYYEYVMDVQQLKAAGKNLNEVFVSVAKYNPNNEEVLAAIRDVYNQYGIYNSSYQDGIWTGILKWKRSDMIEHFNNAKPWSSMQCIASHSIIVEAVGQKNVSINFQDWKITKTGAVTGDIAYKMKLEDDQGWIGPATELSKQVTAKGAEVALSDIYVPDDERITRKRLYRTDNAGNLRYLDTIDREEDSYLDNIPEELLGDPIPADLYRPPKANIMELSKNSMIYANVIDRLDRYRPSRIYISEPFAPHQCSDAMVFDVMPEDGQEITGVKWHYGYYIVWKTKSMYTVDPETFQYLPRDEEMGNIAPESLVPIPGIGFGWLSSDKRVVFGDHSNLDMLSGLEVKDDIDDYSLDVLRNAVGFYYNDYYIIFLGDNNEKGYACYIPEMKWYYLSGWNVWCTSKWDGKADSGEIYAGSANGYVNRLFNGDTDISDDYSSPVTSGVSSTIQTLDYDFGLPHHDKYHQWVTFHAKSLSDDAGDEPRLIVTPIVNQISKSSYKPVVLSKTTYNQAIIKGYDKQYGTLLGVRIEGKKRYALRDLYIEAGDLGWRPQK